MNVILRRTSLAAVLVTAVAVTACSKGQTDARAETAAAPITIGAENVAVVTPALVTTGPVISGSLAAERDAAIRAQTGGAVIQTYADQGTRVAAGQVLARLDDSAIRDQLLSAKSGVTTMQQSYEVAKRNAERAEKLLAAGAIADRDAEQARWNLTAATSQLADARARFAAAEKMQSNTVVTAPFNGIVGLRQVSAGDVVGPGAALFTVVDPSSMRLEATVPAEQLGFVRLGLPVTFTVRGYDRAFSGRITQISPVADPVTRQVRIVVSIPNSGNRLVAGLFAEGRVSSESRQAPMIPLAAVDQRGVQPTVMRVKKGIIERVAIQLGITDSQSESVEVRAGLAPGDTVVLGAAQGITPGTAVRVGVITDAKR